jgi:hypothetical protein
VEIVRDIAFGSSTSTMDSSSTDDDSVGSTMPSHSSRMLPVIISKIGYPILRMLLALGVVYIASSASS